MAPTLKLKQVDPISYKRLTEKCANLRERLQLVRERKAACRVNETIYSIENSCSEWFCLIDEETRLLKELASIETELFQCNVIETEVADSTAVALGAEVTISISYANGEIEENIKYVLVSLYPDISKNEISKESPIGSAIIGKHVGDHVSFSVPASGISGEITIISIRNN